VELEQQVSIGVKWTAIATLLKAVTQLLLLSIAAKYFLSAGEFGLYAVVQVVLGFAQLFMDIGLGNAIIHRQDFKTRHITELFLVNLLIGIVLCCIVFASSSFVALFFASPNVEEFLLYIAPSFIVTALFRMHLVMLQKELAFNLIAKIEVLAQFIGFTVAVMLLNLDFNLTALILGYLSNLFVQGICYWYLSPYKVTIQRPKSFKELKPCFPLVFFKLLIQP